MKGTFLTKPFPFSASLLKAQLLELRTNNYQLSDELRKNGVGEPEGLVRGGWVWGTEAKGEHLKRPGGKTF